MIEASKKVGTNFSKYYINNVTFSKKKIHFSKLLKDDMFMNSLLLNSFSQHICFKNQGFYSKKSKKIVHTNIILKLEYLITCSKSSIIC